MIISDNSVGYSVSISERNCATAKVIATIKSAKEQLRLYPMVVVRRQLNVGNVHIDIDSCILQDGTRYSVQSVKSNSKDDFSLFLETITFEVVNSKLYHLLWKIDNFLQDSKCTINQSCVVMRSKLLRFMYNT